MRDDAQLRHQTIALRPLLRTEYRAFLTAINQYLSCTAKCRTTSGRVEHLGPHFTVMSYTRHLKARFSSIIEDSWFHGRFSDPLSCFMESDEWLFDSPDNLPNRHSSLMRRVANVLSFVGFLPLEQSGEQTTRRCWQTICAPCRQASL